jgi:hypothetical protein
MTGACLAYRTLAIGACAAVLAAVAGCASASSTQNPLLQHALHGTLTCQSVMASGHTLGNDISTLATDNQAIRGQWADAEAETMGGSTSPSAAQNQAITDLTATLSDLGAGGGTGHLATTITALDTDASVLTNGASGWRSAGPKVSADIATLNKACGASAS